MNIKKVNNELTTGRWVVPLSIFFSVALRFCANIPITDITVWINNLLQIGMALILLQINHSFTIVQRRTMFPAMFFLLFTATSPANYYDLTGNLICLGILLCIVFMLRSYQEPLSQGNAFNIFMIVTIISIFWTPVLFLIPFFWIGLYSFRALNFRSFLASIVGILIVYLFIFTWSVYIEDNNFFLEKLPDWKELVSFQFTNPPVWEWIYVGFIIFLILLTRMNSFISRISEKIRTNAFLNYLYFMAGLILVLFLYKAVWIDRWLLLLFIPVSLITSHYFTLSVRKITLYLLYFTAFFFLCFYLIELWRMP